MSQYEKSIDQYRQALRIINSFMEDYHKALALNYLGQAETFVLSGDLEEATMYLELASTFAESGEAFKLQIEVEKRLADLAGPA